MSNHVKGMTSCRPPESEISNEKSNKSQMDLINRQDAIEWCLEGLNNMPSAQPNLPEWARKVEEYRKSAPDTIYNPLAWALYQAWKEYDR